MSSLPRKDAIHSWSVAMFETYRNPLTDFLKQRILPLLDASECQRVLIRAPVKSGKREMVEYLAKRDEAHMPLRVHAFISAFHRAADESQRAELKGHNMEVFSLTSKQKADTCIAWIRSMIASGKKVVLHIDECDFASGDRQVLSKVYRNVRTNQDVNTILYSATPQEVLFSGEVEEDEHQEMLDEIIHTGERVEYTPPPSFCGPSRFLEEGLVIEAIPFFRKTGTTLTLSQQGHEIITDLRRSIASGTRRNILILRLSYSDLGGSTHEKLENKSMYQFLKDWQTIPELSDCLVYADKSEKDIPNSSDVLKEKIQWSNKRFWDAKRNDIPIIIAIDQTSSRSTEWKCHDRVFATHDFRNKLIFSTISQAQERVNHYTEAYGGFQPIKVYGHKKSFQLSAGMISYTDYMNHDWEKRKVDQRVADRSGLVGPHYNIRKTSGNRENHPLCRSPLPESECNRILQEIGCFAEVKVSARVRGGTKLVPIYDSEFYPCTKQTFSSIKTRLESRFPDHRFQNPFTSSEQKGLDNQKYKGYLREWKVFDYETQVKTQPGWGVGPNAPRLTICYRDQILGVALRFDTGRKEIKNTLTTFKSMYAQ
jgi:hypothetical protein